MQISAVHSVAPPNNNDCADRRDHGPDWNRRTALPVMLDPLLARLSRAPQLAALRHRGFRLLWFDTLFATTGRWADVVVIGWLTLELTNSATWVGVVAASKMAGYFVAPFMGGLADRMDRRRLLLGAAMVNCTVAITMLFQIGRAHV